MSTFTLPTPPRLRYMTEYPFASLGKRLQKLKAEGRDIIRIDIGSPDLPPPPAVIDSLAQSTANPSKHGYSGYRGIPEFRRAIAKYYQERFNVDLDPDTEVMPLLGSKEGIVNMTLALVGAGDVVLVPSLAYPAYAMGARLAEASIAEMPLKAENNFLPILENIRSYEREQAKLLWVNYPNNPTGAICSLDFYEEAVNFCRENDILLCSDNAYIEVMFDGLSHAPSALEIPDAKNNTVEFISCSKSYNMAGWRLGAVVGNAEVLKALLCVKSNIDSGHFTPIYDAGITAIETTSQEWFDERNTRYENRRDLLVETLPKIGLSIQEPPKGSLYIWAKVEKTHPKAPPQATLDTTYTEYALLEGNVSITPGSVYGKDGEGYVRISLGINENTLQEALNRLINLWN